MIEGHMEEAFMAGRSFEPTRLANPSVLTDEELKSLHVPILFMIGENEKIYSPHEALARLQKLAPKIQTKLIKNAGHDLTFAQTEMVNDLMLAFLNQPLSSQ